MLSLEDRTTWNEEHIERVAQGQDARTVLDDTNKIYISKCSVMSNILHDLAYIRDEALESPDANGVYRKHIGIAKGIHFY